MRKRSKWILGILGALVAVVIVGLVVLYFSLDGIIRSRVETSTAAATGQTTTLQGANLALFSGSLGLNGLDVQNPQGFGTTPFMSVKDTNIGVQIGSLMSNTVQVPTITIDGLHIVIAQNGLKNNLQEILQAVQKTRDQTAAGAAPATASKQLNIGRITLTNTTITFQMQGIPGVSGGNLDVPIKQMVIDHPTNPDGRAMRIADVLAQVLLATSQAALNDARVPDQVRTIIGQVTKAGKDLPGLLQQLQKGKLGQQATQGVNAATQSVNNLVQGIQGLINKNQNKSQPAQ